MITVSRSNEFFTLCDIAILHLDNMPAISIRASDCGEPVCHQFRYGKPVRVRSAHPGLTFEETIKYWTLVLEGKATIHAELDLAA